MKMFTIPNLITLINLLCGCVAIVFAFEGNLIWSAYLVGIACVLDFLDGFLARKLNQHSPIGMQLDSLADMVTFGVVPGVVMFQMMKIALYMLEGSDARHPQINENVIPWLLYLPYCAFLIPLFSALRLAKFNIDTRQSESFIGLPTPANSIFVVSFPLILEYLHSITNRVWTIYPATPATVDQEFYLGKDFIPYHESYLNGAILNFYFLIGLTIVMSILLISEIPLFALKFKNFGWKGNEIRYSFLALCVVLLATLQFVGIPLTIVLYILMSVVNNLMKKKVSSN